MTSRQHDLMVFLRRRLAETGVCPSYDEIAAAIGVKGRSDIHRLVTALCAAGMLRRRPGRQRSLEPVGVLTPAEIAWCHDHADEVRAWIGRAPIGGAR